MNNSPPPPAYTVAGLAPLNSNKPMLGVDPKPILLRLLNEETALSIAQSLNITRSALYQFLMRTAEQDWKDIQVCRALARKEAAEEEMDAATDGLVLARARERLKSAQWDLERVYRRIYGQDLPAAISAVQINIGINRAVPVEQVKSG